MLESRKTMRNLAVESSILKSMASGDNKYIRKYQSLTKDLYDMISKDADILQEAQKHEIRRFSDMQAALQSVEEKEKEIENLMQIIDKTTDSTEKGILLTSVYDLQTAKRKSMLLFKNAITRMLTDLHISDEKDLKLNIQQGGACVCITDNVDDDMDELFCFCV